jgi:5-methylcytosine-specific restriction endonuclease McrA
MADIKKLTPEDVRFLFNELRKSSVIWSGRKEILRDARRKVFMGRTKAGKAIYKYHWQCAICGKWTEDEKQMEVDHIKEIGGVSEFTGDWNEAISRIFPRPVKDHLQALCVSCHLKKTNSYNSARTKWKRKREPF